jgi:Na+/H+ antiporter NhaD/arsenite permease-like protein
MSWNFVPVVVALLATYCIVRVAANGAPPAAAQPVTEVPVPSRPLNRAHAVKGVVILAAVIGLFFTSLPREIVVLVAAGIHLASARYSTEDLLALVDWQILVLFMSLFIVSGAFQSTGYGEDAVRWLQGAGFNPDLPANLALLTAGMTALINNAPAVMLLIKIVPITHASTAYIMAVANSFGGNVILTASVANIIVAQQARKLGITVTFREFVRLGLPITLVSLAGLIGWATLMGP